MAEDVLQRAIRRTGGLSGWQEGTAICGRQAKRGRHEAEHHVPRGLREEGPSAAFYGLKSLSGELREASALKG